MRIQKYLAPYGQMKLIEGPHFLQPEVDISVAPKLLKYAVDKSAGSIARMYRPQRTAALTSRDISTPGFDGAVAQAEKLGFSPVIRSPGGRAVAYHEESLVFELLSHDPDPHKFMDERFKAIGQLFIETFAQLGIKSKLGEVPREFCPGKYSVISENIKLVGTAQRVTRGGWLIAASVIVRNAAPIREVLHNIYRALEIDMDKNTIAALNEFDSQISVEDVVSALRNSINDHIETLDLDLALNDFLFNRELVG